MIGRIRFVLGLLIFCFCLIIIRLFYWQVVRAEELTAFGRAQYGASITLSQTRGEIKTSDGFPIATNKLSYLLFANPKEVKDKKQLANFLYENLSVDFASSSALLSSDKLWVPLKSKVDISTKEILEQKKLPGVGFEQQADRLYPEASLAASLIGFVGKDDLGEDKGYFGLEGFYDRQLKGRPGVAVQIHDALGRPILSQLNERSGAINGRSLITSIDRTVQFIAEKKLKEGIDRYGALGGMVGIIDPRTGSVIAMAAVPNFDPQKYWIYPDYLYKNPFVSNTFEPGSTFKSLIMSIALDSNVVTPQTRCPICSGPISIGGFEIKTWDGKYHKDPTMVEVIQRSDNTGMAFVGRSIGLARMLTYLDKFGIGKLTGIDVQGEVAPAIKEEDKWYPIDVMTASFGQGISVTPIELLVAFSAIANGGIRMEPHIVSKIETPEGETLTVQPKIASKPISGKTAKVMAEILVNAVEKGEAKWAKPKGYRIAGKTGTAQIPIAGHYDPNKTITSFIGFAPADNPKFAMLVIVDRPTTSSYGSETAAPIFFDIAKDILTYYAIPPSE